MDLRHRQMSAELARTQALCAELAADLAKSAKRYAEPDGATHPGNIGLAAGRLEAALAKRDALRDMLARMEG